MRLTIQLISKIGHQPSGNTKTKNRSSVGFTEHGFCIIDSGNFRVRSHIVRYSSEFIDQENYVYFWDTRSYKYVFV